jgi:creatinine amidohydrolase
MKISMLIEEMTSEEFKASLQHTDKVIIPIGSVEAHGPHLPLATDLYTINELCKLAVKEVNALLAPPIYYGLCRSTHGLSGTISIRGETLKQLLLDILCELYLFGLKKFIILSGHAGGTHLCYLVDACEEFVRNHPETKAFVANICDLLKEAFSELNIPSSDSHAGEWETSLILYLKPHLVKEGGFEDYPKFPRHWVVSNKKEYWSSGIWGRPNLASAKKGEILAQKFILALKQALADFY